MRLEAQFVPFLVLSLLPVFLMPVARFRGTPLERLVLPGMLTLLIVQSIRTLPVIRGSPRAGVQVMAYRLLGLTVTIALWIPLLFDGWPSTSLRIGNLLGLSLFFLITSVRFVRLLARVPRVNLQVLAGAAAGYVHLGITGGILATTIQVMHPGSFNLGAAAQNDFLLDRLTYFSFVTLGGLGYGDVLPANPVGERLAILLSLSSTLYVSLLVGLLLGRYISAQDAELIEEELGRDGLGHAVGSERARGHSADQ